MYVVKLRPVRYAVKTRDLIRKKSAFKAAVRRVYSGFFQPEALLRRLCSFRTLFDFGFYYRGLRSILGHLLDFKGK